MNITLDRRANLAFHLQIAHQIRRMILNREVYVNKPLIEPNQLADQLGIEASVVTQAYARLIQEQLVLLDKTGAYRVKYYDAPKSVISEYTSIFEGVQKLGYTPSVKTLKRSVLKASDVPELKLSKDEPILFTQRVYYADLKPIAYVEGYFPLLKYPGLDKLDLVEEPDHIVFARHYNLKPQRNTRSFYATLLSEDMAKVLETDKGSPSFAVDLTIYDDEDELIEYSITHLVENLQVEWLLNNPSLDQFY